MQNYAELTVSNDNSAITGVRLAVFPQPALRSKVPRPNSILHNSAHSRRVLASRLTYCIMVMHHDAGMRRTKSKAPRVATRITVTLPQQNYEIVVRMAKSKRVSTSWIVRDAV